MSEVIGFHQQTMDILGVSGLIWRRLLEVSEKCSLLSSVLLYPPSENMQHSRVEIFSVRGLLLTYLGEGFCSQCCQTTPFLLSVASIV